MKHFLYQFSREKMDIWQILFKRIRVIIKFEPEIAEPEIECRIEFKVNVCKEQRETIQTYNLLGLFHDLFGHPLGSFHKRIYESI